ncbi:uncharacterized protein LAESUDRAFT_645084 [Laetiporus sulphureus 93-53]|uniref:LYC1 C-terminal domain-containing protein n=1 Tax=Laetiporus sulphureus 93-53 TaxID=1314785 RepID=A0A165GGV4_9APHY|nr:uncharacterized protein LAESUDRAFT_645084 [Laetiporus sulphureus 93-53]KZT10327.1 hypothetical protein LAESUDRAFT_645084 [Laetiporus sulphureus 93-53]
MSTLSLADLSLFPATREQTIESRRRSAKQWAKGLSLEQYFKRDEIMERQEHATDGRLITWVLAHRADPTTLDFMCSCETFRRTAVVAKGETLSDVVAYGIASVFTPLEKRRKGYAQHMMRLLHWAMASRSALPPFPAAWGSPPEVASDLQTGDGRLSVLYSDVGHAFYHACGTIAEPDNGWINRGSYETVWQGEGISIERQDGEYALQWKCLTEEDLELVWAQDAAWIKGDISRASKSSPRTLFTFLPDKGVAASTVQRTITFTAAMKPIMQLDTWGVINLPKEGTTLQDALSGSEPSSFATWTLDILASSPTLVVTRARATVHTFPALLHGLMEFARKQSIKRIEIWGLPDNLLSLADEQGWRTRQRAEHLSMFKWYGEEKDDEVDWLFNEK